MALEKFLDKMKVALGRKLSQSKLNQIRQGVMPEGFKLVGDQIVETIEYIQHAVTHDASHPEILHEGYYPVGRDNRFYDLQGRLLAVRLYRNEPAGPTYKDTTKVYTPAGSFFGKTAERYQVVEKVEPLGDGLWRILESDPDFIRDFLFYNPIETRESIIPENSIKPIRQIKVRR
jgi:hypothetical protein